MLIPIWQCVVIKYNRIPPVSVTNLLLIYRHAQFFNQFADIRNDVLLT